jgi:hypothetical protein
MEFVGIVVGVRSERRGNYARRLNAAQQVVIDERAMRDLGARIGPRKQLLCALDGGQHHIDGDIAIGVAVDLDAGAMHALDPGVELLLRFGDVALVRRVDARIGRAERHGAFRERPVDSVLGSRAQADPLVAEAAHDAARDHRFQHPSTGLVANAVQQVSARAYLLKRRQIAAFVVDAGDAVTHELLGNVGQPSRSRWAICCSVKTGRLPTRLRAPVARSVTRPLSSPLESRSKVPPERIGRVLIDASHLEGLAVVERGVAAAMVHRDRMVLPTPGRGHGH